MKNESKKMLGLARVKRWLYAKGLEERSSGCVLCGSCYGHGPANPMEDVPGPKTKCPPYEFYRFQRFTPKSRWLMAQRVFHGLDAITPELKEVIYTCTNCLMCQELCGVRDDGFGPWDITVAMREEMTEKDGPIEAHRPIFEGLQQHDHPWSQPKAERGLWANGLGLKKLGSSGATTLLFAGCSADRNSGKAGAIALAKLMQKAGEDFVILGNEEKCCGLYAYDLGFRREYDRLEQENLTRIKAAGIQKVVVACGSCRRIWQQYVNKDEPKISLLHGVEYVDRSGENGPATIHQHRPKKSDLSRFLPSWPGLWSIRSAEGYSALDSWNRVSGDGAQSALGLVLWRWWWCSRGLSGAGTMECRGPDARGKGNRRRIGAYVECAMPA